MGASESYMMRWNQGMKISGKKSLAEGRASAKVLREKKQYESQKNGHHDG
jgi:hypothetical protein